ncbi:Signal transduction histidine kinase [Saccharopolyspora kobensis]|uniref:histidine kinase n=1 Tax=Saccharopolyspora kobensis TaxID=146035 RepID=A0A1H6CA91_9PSEU|nr:HAMP domain-containing sensor histidine kinase [Saccharopolyspora kobensis]SEG69828.1 Signal transduction histidine kinase [Saccharopolyspora kobensis]SFC33579.1 Signal transduction histidine kinase [Saccharopolyspora kobensis]
MNAVLIALVAISESAGVGLLGVVALRLLRPHPVGLSLLAITGITVCAMNAGTVTAVLIARSVEVSPTAHVVINLVAGAVAVLIGLLLVRTVPAGRCRPVGETHRAGDPPPDAELARELSTARDEPTSPRLRERAAEASRRRLITWVSRYLRDPVHRIQRLIESIEDGAAGELPTCCRQIRTDAEQVLGVVDDLLELSRARAGENRLEAREVALDDLVSDEVASLGALAGENGIRLRAEVVEQVLVRVDDRSMTRVLNALLVNGIRCSPAGAVISVGVRETGGQAVVSVADECGGIPECDLGSVFEAGWNAAGPGLAIAQEIVRAHDGGISVRNVPGGCRFEVRIPLPRRTERVDSPPAAHPIRSSETSSRRPAR